MQTIGEASEDDTKTESRVLLGLLVILGILQIGRGVLNSLLNYRSYHLGPLTPPGIDVSVFFNPIFLYLYIIDISLIVMIPFLRKSRIPFFVLFSLDILLAFEVAWYRFAVYRPYDWFLIWFSIGVSMLSILHLFLLLAWNLVYAKESEITQRTRPQMKSQMLVVSLFILGLLQALRGLLNLVSYTQIALRIVTT